MRGPHCGKTNRGEPISDNHNMFYADVKKLEDQSGIFTLRDHDVNFSWNNNTFTTALHVALWMGCKNIYLFGCDLDNSNKNYLMLSNWMSGKVNKGKDFKDTWIWEEIPAEVPSFVKCIEYK